MQLRTEGLRAGLAVVALLVAATAVAAQDPTPAPAPTPTPTPAAAPTAAPEAPACAVTLDPAMFKPQADAFQVKATLSQSIGDAMGAEIQEPNSGIDVSIVPATAAGAAHAAKKKGAKKPAAQAAPAGDVSAAAGQVVNLRLATGAAKAGDYTLNLKGASGSCSGKIHLDEAAGKTGP